MAIKKTPATAPAATQNEGSQPANIAPATSFDPSGAPDQVVDDVDPSHPAVDNNPREHTSVDQNRIDFNDPVKPGHVVVAEQLSEQGLPTHATDTE